MPTARIASHLFRRSSRGLWPVVTARDGVAFAFEWPPTPEAKARLDASRAGTLGRRPPLEMAVHG